MMKRIAAILTITLLAGALAACSKRESTPPASEASPDAELSTPLSEAPASDTPSTSTSSDGSANAPVGDMVTAEYTVEIYPALNSQEPVETPPVTFTMQVPANWVLGEETTWQYLYNWDIVSDDLPQVIIQGWHKVGDSEKPFDGADVQYDSTLAIEQLDNFAYPVLRTISEDDRETVMYYAYDYFVQIGDDIVQVEFLSSKNDAETLAYFDGIVQTFVVK